MSLEVGKCKDEYVQAMVKNLELEEKEKAEKEKEEEEKKRQLDPTLPPKPPLTDEEKQKIENKKKKREESLQQTMLPFGEAFYNIALKHAEVISSQDSSDADFWKWVNDVDGWLKELKAWQIGMNKAFQDWQPTQPTEKQLQEKLKQLPALKDPPKKPMLLKGKIQ